MDAFVIEVTASDATTLDVDAITISNLAGDDQGQALALSNDALYTAVSRGPGAATILCSVVP